MPFHVYILRCSDGSYYTGHTDNLEVRMAQHQRGEIPGYTRTRRPVTLVFAGKVPNRVEALERERRLKGWSRAKKEALIKINWGRLQRLTQAFSGEPKAGRSADPSIRSGFAGVPNTFRTRPGRADAGRPRLPAGKLPNELLAALLAKVQSRDPRVLLGPGIGRDAAVIDAGGSLLLVAKSDPITFATDLIGWYAVHVNANDVACLGARPAWFLATVLLPEGSQQALAEAIFDQVLDACRSLGIELVGGHTEVTFRLDRPIVAGALLGEVGRERLVRPDGARPGDALILTKGIAIEGTSVLAREAGERLQALGMAPADVEKAKAYISQPGISVVREALAACDAVVVHAMHDPTEGGLATALHEMAEASETDIVVDGAAIEILPQTRILCEKTSIDPLGLLASGALLIAVAEGDCERALEAVRSAGAAARRIGTLAAAGDGVIMKTDNSARPVPRFARDEVARFLSELG